ncbi:MAG: STAS domain-containing protein [Nitrospirales bacterium]
MEIKRKDPNPEEIILIITGQLDFLVRKDFQAAIQEAQAEGKQHIILDLTEVSSIDCTAVGILVRAKQELADAQIRLSLRTAPGHVLDVLKLLNVDTMLPVAPIKRPNQTIAS